MIVDADDRTRRALRGRRIGKRRRIDAVSPHLFYVLCGKPGVWTPRLPLSGRQHCWLLIVCSALCCCTFEYLWAIGRSRDRRRRRSHEESPPRKKDRKEKKDRRGKPPPLLRTVWETWSLDTQVAALRPPTLLAAHRMFCSLLLHV